MTAHGTVAGKAGGGVVRVRAAGGGRRPPGWGFESGTADLARRHIADGRVS